MLGEIGREGRAGVVITFLLEGTEEELWKAPMNFVPRMKELVGLLENGDVTTWYEVEEVRYELHYATLRPGGGETPEIEEQAPYADVAPCVIVSEV